MATYNSERLLPLVLDAIDRQDFPRARLEILIVDGGSTDGTRALAERRGCRVIDNPRTEPVYAKFLGINAARGHYAVFLDHDEVMESPRSLSVKQRVFAAEPSVRTVICGGYKNPNPENVVNEYVNEFGDPFSFFMYRLSKAAHRFVPTLRRRYRIARETPDYLVVDFEGHKRLPIIELVAAGTMIDREFFLRQVPELAQDERPIGHLFYYMLPHAPAIAVAKDDFLVHHSSESWKKFLAKIRWRVKNNVFFTQATGAAGFTGRRQFEPTGLARYRQYLYPLYAFTLLPALLDTLVLCATRRRLGYLAHLPLTLYTAGYIVSQVILRALGHSPLQRSYDEGRTLGRKT